MTGNGKNGGEGENRHGCENRGTQESCGASQEMCGVSQASWAEEAGAEAVTEFSQCNTV
jgi:hypothetical protein